MATNGSEHYTVISADTHAGGSHAAYREYLDADWQDAAKHWRLTPKNEVKDAASNHSPRFKVDENALLLGLRALTHVTCDYLETVGR